MATVEYKGHSFEVDEDGFLQKFEDWNLEWVDYVKDSEGIKELTPEHNKVIEFLQDYYKKNGIAPMVRIQIARDSAMAVTAREALRAGQTVLLVAGGGHVLRSQGVPTHWPENIQSKVVLAQSGKARDAIKTEDADAWVPTPATPAQDHCAELRRRWGTGTSGG